MYTFGYLREATQAHLDLNEEETQAMHLQERYHIFANEAMQAICGTKPKYSYFEVEIVAKYRPIIHLGNNEYRQATDEEINWESHITPDMTYAEINALKPNFADALSTKLWYEGQNIYLLNTPVHMPDDFIAFANKQAWAFIRNKGFDPEKFINNYNWDTNDVKTEYTMYKANKSMFIYIGSNALKFLVEGKFHIPYKAIWYRFVSGITDNQEIDMPVDIFFCIPLYIAAQCLQVDHAQRALAKRSEFETALARVTNTDFLDLPSINPSFE